MRPFDDGAYSGFIFKNKTFVLFSALCLLPFFVSTANAQQNWQELRKQYLRLSDDTTKKDSALLYAYTLKEVAKKQYGKKSKEYYSSLNSIGYCEFQLKQYDLAIKTWLDDYQLLQKTTDTVFYTAKNSVTSNLYSNIYTNYHKQADSALIFAIALLKIQGKIHGEITREQLDRISNVAYKLEQNFGRKYSDALYEQTLVIRRAMWGEESVNITRQLDSMIIQYASPGQIPGHRFEVYNTAYKKYTYAQLRALAENAKASNQWWDYLTYSITQKDEALLEFPNSISKYADALEDLAVVYQDFGIDSIAVFCDKKVLQAIGKYEGVSNVDYADALFDMGCIYRYSNPLKAERYYKDALSLYGDIKGRMSNEYAVCLTQLAGLYTSASGVNATLFKNPDELALACYNDALIIKGNLFGKTSLEYETVLSGKAGNYLAHAKLDEAEPLYLECWKIYQLHYPDTVSLDKYYLVRQLQRLYMYKNQLAKEIPWLEKCIGLLRVLKDTTSFDYIQDMFNLSRRYLEAGNITQAKNILKEVEKQSANFKKPSTTYGLFLRMKFDIEDADYAVKDSLLNLIIDNKYQMQDTTSYGLSQLAELYGDAADFYQQNKLTDKAYKYILSQFRYLNKAHVRGNYVSAEKMLGEYFAYFAHNPDSAKLYFGKALEDIKLMSANASLFYSELQLSAACFYWYNDEIMKANKLMTEACTKIKNQMLLNMAGLSEAEKEHYNKELQQSIQKYYNFHQSVFRNYPNLDTVTYNYTIQSKGLLLSTGNRLKNQIAASGDTSLKNKYLRLVSAKKQLAEAYTLNNNQQTATHLSVPDLENQSAVLEEQLSASSTAYSDFRKQNHLKFENIRKALKPEDVAIEFIAFPYFHQTQFTDSIIYAAFIVKPNSNKPIYVPLASDDLIKPYIQNQGVTGRGAIVTSDIKNVSAYRKLYQLIFQPLALYLKNVKRIYISTDGLLNKIAFASLQDASGKYLIDRYELRFLLNTRDVASKKNVMLKAGNLTCALFGGAIFDATTSTVKDSLLASRSLPRGLRGSSSWDYLPGTLSEVQSINSILKGQHWSVAAYTDMQASEKNFKDKGGANAPAIIHIATHGFYFPLQRHFTNSARTIPSVYQDAENPLMRSGLVFASANKSWLGAVVAEGDEDGILTAYELANMDLSNTQLVVLSACETGVGQIMNGEGVFGLQRALRQAGVKKMIVSLWPVSDKETAEMMEHFYSALAISKNINASFRLAQAKMRSKYPDKPALWAGFLLME